MYAYEVISTFSTEDLKGELGEKLLKVQGALMHVMVGSGHPRINKTAVKILEQSWKANPEGKIAAMNNLINCKEGLTLPLMVISGYYIDLSRKQKVISSNYNIFF